jgi:hypothetical protein
MTNDSNSRADRDTFDRDKADPADDGPPSLKSCLKDAGWREVKAYIEPTPGAASVGAAAGESPKSRSEAKRKAAQRERDRVAGWRQHNVRAPDTSEARELIAHVAERVKSKQFLRIVRAVLADPDLVKIGRKVRRLRGPAADEVRTLLKL